jgi:hypothetical protein
MKIVKFAPGGSISDFVADCANCRGQHLELFPFSRSSPELPSGHSPCAVPS